ncbi:MAG: hypothetical protein DMG21_10245 [Acidobacteria bacterium]|nr:MAG: hypothetical protein DMG21_10245 [Acidobacteriota bacterium]
MRIHKIVLLAGVLAALGTFGCSNETKPATPATPSAASASPAAATKDSWVSQTTGNEYRVRPDPDHFSTEWTNMSGAFLAHGAYIRSECKRQGTKWVGESHSHLPCAAANLPSGQYSNWCDLVTKIEFDEVTPTRISGYGEGVKKIDCQKCQILETSWKPFVWVPKK